MFEIKYVLTLKSDAEPGSGFGTETINSLVPLDVAGKPVIPSTHLKGIMRENLLTIAKDLKNSEIENLVKLVFGTGGGRSEGKNSVMFISNAECCSECHTLFVTRTSLNVYGIAENSTLRTKEAIPVGTEFRGRIGFYSEPVDHVDLLVKLGLLTVRAIGSSRSRGCGECNIVIDNTQLSPGTVLKQLLQVLPKDGSTILHKTAVFNFKRSNSDEIMFLKLKFIAESPVCVPEKPVVGTNTIQSGYAIPASAVQGMILHRINNYSNSVASNCFSDARFRAWPLLPTIERNAGLPVFVPLTHRVSKLKDEHGFHHFFDAHINDCGHTGNYDNSLMRHVDGVIVPTIEGNLLYKASDIARIITVHGVHNDPVKGRNLFTTESIAPIVFEGLVTISEEAEMYLAASIESNDFVTFGKARSVRGGGRLSFETVDSADLEHQKYLDGEFQNRLFVAQSPLLLPDEWENSCANEMLSRLVENSGWGAVEAAVASIGVLFGWNAHGMGKSYKNGRLRAVKVIEPGSVFLLKKKIENPIVKFVKGIGEGKQQGFGSILPHPGIVRKCYEQIPVLKRIRSKKHGSKDGFDLFELSKDSGISASQINFLRQKFNASMAAGFQYLDSIKAERPDIKWDRWKHIDSKLRHIINEDYQSAIIAVKVWHDLTVARRINYV